METPEHTSFARRLAPAATVSLLLTVCIHVVWGDVALGLADEGFLWYGIQRVLEGQVPLRDFQSYEPGRYYWGAAWGLWRGDGVLAMREAIALFQWLGLTCGLLVCQRLSRHPLALLLAGTILAAWMFPRHKVFESSISMMAVLAAVRLLEQRTVRQHLLAGIFCGLMGCMGRNHGIYIACGFTLLIAFTWFRLGDGDRWRKLGAWSAGIVVGFSPVLLMMVLVPGFGAALIENVLFFAEHGANLSKPWPWLWALPWAHLPVYQRIAIGIAFMIPLVVYPLGLVMALRTRPAQLERRTVLLGSVFMGVFYFHHVVELSATRHLAQCIHPGLLALLALPWTFSGARKSDRMKPVLGRFGVVLWCLLGLMTLGVAEGAHPLLKTPKNRTEGAFVQLDVAGDELRVGAKPAQLLALVKRVVERQVPPDESIFIAPFYSTLYPFLGRTSPVWRLYFLWEADDETQDEIIANLTDVNWALIIDEPPIKHRADLKFDATHARVWAYLKREFEIVEPRALSPPRFLFKRRN